jgi:hypothetical protein
MKKNEKKICSLFDQISRNFEKQRLYEQYVADPSRFIDCLISQQNALLKVFSFSLF